MNRNKRAFNIFGNEMPFILPPPIPEPPRVIYPKPMVPDLSITSDMSLNVSPKVKINDNFDKYRTLYPCPPKPESSPNYCLPSLPEQHILRPNDRLFTNRFPSNVKLREKQNERLFTSNLKVNNGTNYKPMDGFCVNQTNHNIINGKNDEKRIPCKSVKPKIIRHSTPDPVLNKNKVDNKFSLKTSDSKNIVNSPTNEEMYELIKQQDIQLQQISEQIQELIQIHKIKDKTVNNNNNKRSVMTMTSFAFETNEKTSPSTRPKTRVSKSVKNKSNTPSTASKDLRALHLQTISECQSEPSDIDLNGLNFTQSPNRSPYLCENASIERIRKNDNNSGDDVFYDHMIHNINSMLNNPSSDETDESGRRSSCSPTPPQFNREPQHRKHQIQLQSEQTVYIKRLAAKYLVDESPVHTKPKYKQKNYGQHHQQHENQEFAINQKRDLKVYGLQKNASIATKNYLEKYGLINSPPKVQKTPHIYDNYELKHNNKQKTFKNRILDLETLKRQPKLT